MLLFSLVLLLSSSLLAFMEERQSAKHSRWGALACVFINVYFSVHFSPLSLPCQRRVGGTESRKSKRRIVETQVSASVSHQDEEAGLGHETSHIIRPPRLPPSFFFSTPIQPGKQLSAIQITCQSGGVMKARLAFQISRRAFKCRCSFGASAFLFLFPFLYV